jgi:hypothetical protein
VAMASVLCHQYQCALTTRVFSRCTASPRHELPSCCDMYSHVYYDHETILNCFVDCIRASLGSRESHLPPFFWSGVNLHQMMEFLLDRLLEIVCCINRCSISNKYYSHKIDTRYSYAQ